MSTNILLIIIIVLLALGLFVQVLQFVAIFSIPDQLIDLFLDSTEAMFNPNETTTVDVVNVDTREQKQSKKFKGFDNSKKSKGLKRKWSRRVNKTSTEATETETEVERGRTAKSGE